MPSYSFRSPADACAIYHDRILILGLASIGIVLSLSVSSTCDFLYLGPDEFSEIDTAFEDGTEGWIGLFRYEIIGNGMNETIAEDCTLYNDIFTLDAPVNPFSMDAPNQALQASQLCALLAPLSALLAVLLAVLELLCCRSFWSFVVQSVLFLAASLFQSGTFGIFLMREDFCFQDNSDGCEIRIGSATYSSALAVFAFFFCCILLCCSPIPDPCMRRNLRITHDEEDRHDLDSRPANECIN